MMDTVCYLEIIKTYIYIYQTVTVYEKMYTDQNMIEPKCNVLWIDKYFVDVVAFYWFKVLKNSADMQIW